MTFVISESLTQLTHDLNAFFNDKGQNPHSRRTVISMFEEYIKFESYSNILKMISIRRRSSISNEIGIIYQVIEGELSYRVKRLKINLTALICDLPNASLYLEKFISDYEFDTAFVNSKGQYNQNRLTYYAVKKKNNKSKFSQECVIYDFESLEIFLRCLIVELNEIQRIRTRFFDSCIEKFQLNSKKQNSKVMENNN